MPPLKDLTGQRFGRLVVCYRSGTRHGGAEWFCECDCGNKKAVRSADLISGHAQSCGCIQRESAKKRKTIHGMRRTRIYNIYAGMKKRCFNPNSHAYEHYGGRGITVCDEWKNSFETFYAWAMANGYADNLTIDRIDNDGNYEPSNCRWVTMSIQSNNTRQNTHLTYAGETHTISEWSHITGIKRGTILYRIKKGLTIEDVLKTR